MTQPPPAEAPAAPQPAAQGASGPRANFGQRLVAWLIDSIIYAVVFFVLFAIAAAISETLAIVVYVIGLIGVLVYYGYFEGSPSGQTPGKKVMKIRVIDFNSGGPIGFGRALVRWVARLVSSLPCYLGYLWMLWDREKQTWHDKLSTSVVVPESAYPVEKWPG
jgi:uncharacterized RDD family membrane protein YckC